MDILNNEYNTILKITVAKFLEMYVRDLHCPYETFSSKVINKIKYDQL